MIKVLGDSHDKEMYDLLVEVTDLRKFVEEELHVLWKDVDEVRVECQSRHASNGNASISTSYIVVGTHGIKVPKPNMYNNTRNATMVENFLFGLEQYYEALGIVDDGAKIANASNFLHESTQLW
uniref:Senescence-specific cysteine protease sag39 n=1 Tax=Cucumis melo TaxID=3656 RepID=A0A9I9E545_CUCME